MLRAAQDPDAFIAVMQQWAAAYGPSPLGLVPGMAERDFARVAMPVLSLERFSNGVEHAVTRKSAENKESGEPDLIQSDRKTL
ncbi:hypothetical protein [Novosphingobium clariflavum]|uniref:Uncharacterized protein n=1 Tax=Novosphingobium clariflavum TaxID=2029884 RepID=A0ABV6S4I0_9SPHN|nr:hypothetical protein [Novosphingobium clariflavum]